VKVAIIPRTRPHDTPEGAARGRGHPPLLPATANCSLLWHENADPRRKEDLNAMGDFHRRYGYPPDGFFARLWWRLAKLGRKA